MGVIVGAVRRKLSVAAVKAQADCLLNRMNSIGQGAAAASKRRQWALWEEDRWRRAQKPGQQQTDQEAWVLQTRLVYLYNI